MEHPGVLDCRRFMVFAGRRVRHYIISVGASRQSTLAACALGTAPLSHLWLPIFEHYADEDDGDRQRFADMAPIEPWITDIRAELKIDKHDPYASSEAVRRARPAKHIIDAMALRADEPWTDAWRDGSGRAVLRALAWGCRKGRGRHESSDSGLALKCERAFLSELLTALNRDLILLVKLRHYRERQRHQTTDHEPSDPFTYAYLVLSIDRDLRVTHVVPTQHDFDLVKALGEPYEFRNRFRALATARP